MHTPVLLQETIDGLDVGPGKRYIDATYGEGGHTMEILRRGGVVLALDYDEQNVAKHTEVGNEKSEAGKLKLVHGNYADIAEIAKKNNFVPVDGIIFDLGLSMEQIGGSGRGFSYKKREEPLDMRVSLSIRITAADIINSYTEEELYEIFAKSSEELNSRAVARLIGRARRLGQIMTVGELLAAVGNEIKVTGTKEEVWRRLFQALRIEVNSEFENLKRGLKGAVSIVKPGGRIAVITFHPTEDRIVKSLVRNQALTFLKSKPIVSKRDWKFERSAKLRIIEIKK